LPWNILKYRQHNVQSGFCSNWSLPNIFPNICELHLLYKPGYVIPSGGNLTKKKVLCMYAQFSWQCMNTGGMCIIDSSNFLMMMYPCSHTGWTAIKYVSQNWTLYHKIKNTGERPRWLEYRMRQITLHQVVLRQWNIFSNMFCWALNDWTKEAASRFLRPLEQILGEALITMALNVDRTDVLQIICIDTRRA
jgi:hypothetical protein